MPIAPPWRGSCPAPLGERSQPGRAGPAPGTIPGTAGGEAAGGLDAAPLCLDGGFGTAGKSLGIPGCRGQLQVPFGAAQPRGFPPCDGGSEAAEDGRLKPAEIQPGRGSGCLKIASGLCAVTAHTGVPPAALCIMDKVLHALLPAPFGCIKALNIGHVGPAPPGRAARGGILLPGLCSRSQAANSPPGRCFRPAGCQSRARTNGSTTQGDL